MRRILRQREWIEDPWRYPGESAAEGDALIIPFLELRESPQRWLARHGPLGVHIAPAESIEPIAVHLTRLSLVAVEFPSVADGRGFSHATLLRRHRFHGELRAVGAGVKQDLLWLMARCGFDSFDLAEGQDPQQALSALERYSVAYRAGAPLRSVRQVRFAL